MRLAVCPPRATFSSTSGLLTQWTKALSVELCPLWSPFCVSILGAVVYMFRCKAYLNEMLSYFATAFIPVPLLYGQIADTSCKVFEEKCGRTGNCWLYDQEKFRKLLFGFTITFLALGSFFDFLMIFFADRMKNLYVDDDDAPPKEEQIDSKHASNHEMNHIQGDYPN